ncbi:MAG: DUF349 domain-containing protein, partial [Acidobacteria bacterium]|nr:DUF349 domain-containing protein [Acidobacteriota bacterium]
MGLLERLRPQPGWKDPDPKVRRAAVAQIPDAAVVADLARSDPDPGVREEAWSALLSLALEGPEEAAGLVAVAALEDAKLMLQIARHALHESASRAALSRLDDLKALASVARHGRHPAVRLEALVRVVEFPADAAAVRDEIVATALKSPHDDAALSALEHLPGSDRFAAGGAAGPGPGEAPGGDFLDTLAQHGKSRAAVRRARTILHERQAAAAGAQARLQTDRRAQIRLCEKVEALGRSGECESLVAEIAAIQDAWTDLVPHVDDDLDERFQAALPKARERLRHNLAAREEAHRRAELLRARREQHIMPRLRIVGTVEAAAGEDSPRILEDASWEWGRLAALDGLRPDDPVDSEILAGARDLEARFQTARAACQSRFEVWQQDRERHRIEEIDEAARKERQRQKDEQAQEKRDHLARLQKLCKHADRLLKSAALSLGKADPALRDVRTALDAMPPLPSRRDHDTLVERLKKFRAALAPRVPELREAEQWTRWANSNVQEELCARAEELREIADPEAAARRLPDLLERWKSASVAEPDRAQALWQRFKTATEEVRARHEALLARHSYAKRALCEKAEALSVSTDWIKTAEAVKALQTEWKTAGTAARGQEKALWERFRKACDEFFTRRDQDRSRRKEEWAKNLETREALIARAESLADSTDWKITAPELKRLQAEWKTAGPVRPSRSEALWHRFRAACDRFFERYKRRDQIDREMALAGREAICAELERLLPAAGTDGLLPRLEVAWDRWRKCPPLPGELARPVGERFQRALDAVVAASPEALQGTAFDAGANRNRMEDLCARLERLLPGGGTAPDEALSPVTRLATLWREALASNTIGGKVAEEARQRAAAEEVTKARAAWQRIGYVHEDDRRTLGARFERACRRLAPPAERSPAPPRPRRPAT